MVRRNRPEKAVAIIEIVGPLAVPSRSDFATLISTIVKPPLASIAIRSARRPLGSGISHTANRSWRQNRRVTPRATSAAIGGASVKQRNRAAWPRSFDRTKRSQSPRKKEGEPLLARCPPAFRNLAIEDVVADRGDALQAPVRRYVARMEEQRVADRGIL